MGTKQVHSMKRIGLVWLWAAAATAQVVPDHFIVELEGAPAARNAARRATVRQQQLEARRAVEQQGARVLLSVDTVANALVVHMPRSGAQRLAAMRGVVRVHPVLEYELLLDRALPLQRVPDAWTAIGGETNAGAGVKIAIIDTGIDPAHPGFQEPALALPAGFPRGRKEYTNNKIIVARS